MKKILFIMLTIISINTFADRNSCMLRCGNYGNHTLEECEEICGDSE